MEDGKDDIIFHATWRQRPLTGGQYVEWMKGLIGKLRALHPRLAELYFVGPPGRKYDSMPVDPENLAAGLRKHISQQLAWSRESEEKDEAAHLLEFSSTSGFQSVLSTTLKPVQPGLLMTIKAGRVAPPNKSIVFKDSIHFTMSATWETGELAKLLSAAIVEYARPEHAMLWRRSVVAFPDQPIKNFSIGWLTYFADPSLTALVPAGVRVERLADGIVIQASEHLPMSTDLNDVAAITRIFTAFQAAGALCEGIVT